MFGLACLLQELKKARHYYSTQYVYFIRKTINLFFSCFFIFIHSFHLFPLYSPSLSSHFLSVFSYFMCYFGFSYFSTLYTTHRLPRFQSYFPFFPHALHTLQFFVSLFPGTGMINRYISPVLCFSFSFYYFLLPNNSFPSYTMFFSFFQPRFKDYLTQKSGNRSTYSRRIHLVRFSSATLLFLQLPLDLQNILFANGIIIPLFVAFSSRFKQTG